MDACSIEIAFIGNNNDAGFTSVHVNDLFIWFQRKTAGNVVEHIYEGINIGLTCLTILVFAVEE